MSDARSHDARLDQLAAFLRSSRDRVRPQELGLPVGPRRRAVGLLREEVAQIAGISATWYTWLEQARPINPSVRALDALARALRLDPAGRAHLFELARPDLRATSTSTPTRALSEPLAETLRDLAPHPAYVTNARFDILAWNGPAVRLLGHFGRHAPAERNLIHLLFIDPAWRSLFVDWRDVAQMTVAQFRASTARLSSDPEFAKFVTAVALASAEFSELWRSHEVRKPLAWTKRLDHPTAGRMAFNFSSFHPDSADDDLRFTIYTPADKDSERRFAALLRPKRRQPPRDVRETRRSRGARPT
jgi:transcriptional regulator with XRE-family HTH domain